MAPNNQDRLPLPTTNFENSIQDVSGQRKWILGLFDHVETLKPSLFSQERRDAFKLALRRGDFDDEESSRSVDLEWELLSIVAESVATLVLRRKKHK